MKHILEQDSEKVITWNLCFVFEEIVHCIILVFYSHSIHQMLEMLILFFITNMLSSTLVLNLKLHKIKLIANNSHSFS